MQFNLKCGNRLTSHDVNFYKAFFQGLKRQGSQTKLYRVKQVTGKGFPGLGMFSEVICNLFMEDTYLPLIVCNVFGFLVG